MSNQTVRNDRLWFGMPARNFGTESAANSNHLPEASGVLSA